VKTIWTSRVNSAVARYGDVAPTATVCCNTCRTCVQTNLMTAALAGLAATGAFILRRIPRFGGSA
jgi:hypothetical protein